MKRESRLDPPSPMPPSSFSRAFLFLPLCHWLTEGRRGGGLRRLERNSREGRRREFPSSFRPSFDSPPAFSRILSLSLLVLVEKSIERKKVLPAKIGRQMSLLGA